MDRRFNSCIIVHLPTDVDQQARIRRIGTIDCSPQMLLNMDAEQCPKYQSRLHVPELYCDPFVFFHIDHHSSSPEQQRFCIISFSISTNTAVSTIITRLGFSNLTLNLRISIHNCSKCVQLRWRIVGN